MAIENNYQCDECKTRLTEGDEIFCFNCVEELTKEKDQTLQEIESLKDKLEDLSDTLRKLEMKEIT